MGYEFHITRADSWAENEGNQISDAEWLSLIASDPELTLDTRNGPCFAVRSGTSSYEESWFDWYSGNIYTKYPDKAVLEKMLKIALKFEAKVQGDDGEVYESIDDYPDFSIQQQLKTRKAQRIPPYRRREILWNIIVVAVVAVMIITAILLDLW